MPEDVVMIVNDDGLLLHLSPNITHGHSIIAWNLILARDNGDGELSDIPKIYLPQLLHYLNNAELELGVRAFNAFLKRCKCPF